MKSKRVCFNAVFETYFLCAILSLLCDFPLFSFFFLNLMS